MDGVLMTASTPWWRKFDQDPKIRWPQPKDTDLGERWGGSDLYRIYSNILSSMSSSFSVPM
jgi:hypothetical protein